MSMWIHWNLHVASVLALGGILLGYPFHSAALAVGWMMGSALYHLVFKK